MRKFLCYLIILLIPILTGCDANVGTGVFIGPGGVGTDIFFFPSMNRSTLTPKDNELITNVKRAAIDSGYTVIDTSTPDTVSFKASKHVDNIAKNDIDGLPSFVVKDGSRFITVKNGVSRDHYQVKAVVDLSNINSANFTKPVAYCPSITNFRMDIPAQATYTNAQKKTNNGKSLEWNLIPGKKNLIEVAFEVDK